MAFKLPVPSKSPTAPTPAANAARSMYAGMQNQAAKFEKTPDPLPGDYVLVGYSGELKPVGDIPVACVTEFVVLESSPLPGSATQPHPPGARVKYIDNFSPGPAAERKGGPKRVNGFFKEAYNVQGLIPDMDPESYGSMVEGFAGSAPETPGKWNNSTIVGRRVRCRVTPAKDPKYVDKTFGQVPQTDEEVAGLKAAIEDGSLLASFAG